MPFTSETASQWATKPRPNVLGAVRDACALQKVAKKVALSDDVKPSDISSAIKAWVELENLKRIYRGHGAPKAVPATNDPATAKKLGRPRSQAETSDAPASESADSPE